MTILPYENKLLPKLRIMGLPKWKRVLLLELVFPFRHFAIPPQFPHPRKQQHHSNLMKLLELIFPPLVVFDFLPILLMNYYYFVDSKLAMPSFSWIFVKLFGFVCGNNYIKMKWIQRKIGQNQQWQPKKVEGQLQQMDKLVICQVGWWGKDGQNLQ